MAGPTESMADVARWQCGERCCSCENVAAFPVLGTHAALKYLTEQRFCLPVLEQCLFFFMSTDIDY